MTTGPSVMQESDRLINVASLNPLNSSSTLCANDHAVYIAQDAAARLVLDVVLATGRYGLDLHALDFKPCSLLDEMKFATGQVAR